MPVEPAEVEELLQKAEQRGLSQYQQHLLAARCGAGATLAEIAAAWGYSVPTVERDFRIIQDIVLGACGLPRDVALITRWFHLHLDDCLPVARELIAERRVFHVQPPEKGRRRASG